MCQVPNFVAWQTGAGQPTEGSSPQMCSSYAQTMQQSLTLTWLIRVKGIN